MIPDGDYSAVVDHIEDSLATLELSGDDHRYSLVVDEATLPEAAQHADAILQLTLVDEEIKEITYDQTETEHRSDAVQRRFDSLSSRPPDPGDETDKS